MEPEECIYLINTLKVKDNRKIDASQILKMKYISIQNIDS